MIEKLVPVEGYVAGIPWSMYLRAYDAYCKLNGMKQGALIQGRSCFSTEELDVLIPGWREELSQLAVLKERVDKLAVALADVLSALQKVDGMGTGSQAVITNERKEAWERALREWQNQGSS